MPLGRQEHDLGTHHFPVRSCVAARPALQLLPLLHSQLDHDRATAGQRVPPKSHQRSYAVDHLAVSATQLRTRGLILPSARPRSRDRVFPDDHTPTALKIDADVLFLHGGPP